MIISSYGGQSVIEKIVKADNEITIKHANNLTIKHGNELSIHHEKLEPLTNSIDALGNSILYGFIALSIAIIVHGFLNKKKA